MTTVMAKAEKCNTEMYVGKHEKKKLGQLGTRISK
jgi:hypothetical protein